MMDTKKVAPKISIELTRVYRTHLSGVTTTMTAVPERAGWMKQIEKLRAENSALRRFLQSLGFDADKVIEQLSDDANATCKNLSLGCLRVVHDFANSSFSPAGESAANKWLNSLRLGATGDTPNHVQETPL